jgi:hypothetical protein
MTKSVLTVLVSIIGLTRCGSALRESENTPKINRIYKIVIPF